MQPISVIIRHSKIQVPLAVLRSAFGGIWRGFFRLLGRYRSFDAKDLDSLQTDRVRYYGDIPVGAGDSPVQHRRVFRTPRPLHEAVANLVVTPGGAGWVKDVLHERYSSGKPGLRLLTGSNSPKRRVPEGVFVQSEHIDTFGDWMAEYLAPLARMGKLGLPVFLPAALARRNYVIRDAARLGIEFVSIDEPLLIERATVIMQPKVVRYWTKDCVPALRGLLNVEVTPPNPGSLLYLSRHGEASLVADRTHPSLEIEAFVIARGGRFLRTCEATLEDYLGVSSEVETVLFDHGSAIYNMVYWQPRRVIEFTSDDWWMNSFLFFANSLGVDDYTILRSDLPDLAMRLDAALKPTKEDSCSD